MARIVGIGHQNFAYLREKNLFYIDKTSFLKKWWENYDSVTLITRPRRFGKTLNISMAEHFFSIKYAGRSDLFEGLSIWEDMNFRQIQGTYPVISLSFANVKETNYKTAREKICQLLVNLYTQNIFLLENNMLSEQDKAFFQSINYDMGDMEATMAIHQMAGYLHQFYGRKVIILLDEYDTPLQEAYINGYWDEMVSFTRSMFNAAFKTNPHLERALMTGITRISKESIFSDLNNMKAVTATSEEYADSFGFTENEVFASLDEYGLTEQKQDVKRWYDGFTFGSKTDIYNPWSIINYLDTKKVGCYWANSSSNSLVSKLLREGDRSSKQKFESLLKGEPILAAIDEQIVYDQLGQDEQAVWSLLLASGYLKAGKTETRTSGFGEWAQIYELALTNFEIWVMFRNMVHKWFGSASSVYNDFIQALLTDDLKAMNFYMNKVALQTFSYFDTGNNPSGEGPERFYHGFVLGLIVELADRYTLTSNRESGFGRYDVMLEPKVQENGAILDDGILMEFKVQDADEEKEPADTVKAALAQIEKQNYEAALAAKGIPKERIRKYGFAFCGKKVLIGKKKQ